MRITAIFLDFGNVCAEFDLSKFFKRFTTLTEVSEHTLRTLLCDSNHHGYSPLFADLECGRVAPAKFFRLLSSSLELKGKINYRTFAEIWTDIFFNENTELSELLDRLSQEKYLLSNTNKIVYGRHIARTRLVRKHIPLRKKRILSCDVGAIKPDVRIYRHALAVAGKKPGECVFIDDMPVNIAAWQALGGHGIVYHAGTHAIKDLEQELRKLCVLE